MSKIRYFALPAFVVIFSAARAIKLVTADSLNSSFPNNYIFPAVCIAIGILFFAFELKKKYWRRGVIVADLAYISRSAMMLFPLQSRALALVTIFFCGISTLWLGIAWKTIDSRSDSTSNPPVRKNFLHFSASCRSCHHWHIPVLGLRMMFKRRCFNHTAHLRFCFSPCLSVSVVRF